MFTPDLHHRARLFLDTFRRQNCRLVTAESCTGGLIAGLLSEIPGSSDVLEGGFVTYSYASKTNMLGVPAELIASQGAVDAAVALAMAEGALLRTPAAQIALAVTGVAGPGQSERKPAGLVHLCALWRGQTPLQVQAQFDGDRSAVRLATVARALEMGLEVLFRQGASP
jgi:nicotinamide-nucleotide amidase